MPSRTPFFSVPEARKKSTETIAQKPPKSNSLFVVKGLVFRTGFPYEEVLLQTGPKGLQSTSRVGFGELFGQRNKKTTAGMLLLRNVFVG